MPWGGHSPKDASLVCSPSSGPAAGGTSVTVTAAGTQQADFHGTVRATIDGVECTNVKGGANKCTLTTPAHAVASNLSFELYDDTNATADVQPYSYV